MRTLIWHSLEYDGMALAALFLGMGLIALLTLSF
jgi:hypothetical protein